MVILQSMQKSSMHTKQIYKLQKIYIEKIILARKLRKNNLSKETNTNIEIILKTKLV
jgi:hypothetical protein